MPQELWQPFFDQVINGMVDLTGEISLPRPVRNLFIVEQTGLVESYIMMVRAWLFVTADEITQSLVE